MQEFWEEAGRAFPWVGQIIHWRAPATLPDKEKET